MPEVIDSQKLIQQISVLRKNISVLEKKLHESEEKFRTLTVFSPVGIFLDDPEGNAIYLNNRCAELVGVPAERALELNWVPYIHPDDRERVTTRWVQAFTNGAEFHEEYRWVHEDGSIVWTLGDIAPVKNNDNKVILYIGTLTDITAQKEAEKILHK